MNKMKILQFMDPPPPLGGVTLSVKNLVRSCRAIKLICNYRKDDHIFTLYDFGHVHASNKFKRLCHILWLKLKCKKVVFTVHGLWFDDIFINRLCLLIADGCIFLNNDLAAFWQPKATAVTTKLPSLFSEGFEVKKIIERNPDNKLTLLLYAHSRSFHKGNEVYGIEFALESLLQSDAEFKIVLVDIRGDYSKLVEKLSPALNIDYFPYEVDFQSLLQNCDIYLRPTCMDGSSLAVQEALLLGKRVIASNVVERADGVELFNFLNQSDFLLKVFSQKKAKDGYKLKSVLEYVQFLESL
jgi:glycosyltransferase involved in cell wall biosynthesis